MQLQQTLDEIIRVVENNPEFWNSDNLTSDQTAPKLFLAPCVLKSCLIAAQMPFISCSGLISLFSFLV